jgi:hypothetical protein
MSYRGLSNWPPAWLLIGGEGIEHLKGERGTLVQVESSNIPAEKRLFLRIEYNGGHYMGCLLFDDAAFCDYIKGLLTSLCGRTISDIGSTDLSYTL